MKKKWLRSNKKQADFYLKDLHLLDRLSHFDSKRIPERVVHAKGAGGYFEVTADVTRYTKVKFLSEIGRYT